MTTVDIPASTVEELYERAAALLPVIGAGAGERERERQLPYTQIRGIAQAGLLTFRIPAEEGGPAASVAEVFRFILDLAAVDSNIAQALRPDFGFVENLLASGTPVERDRWFPRLLGGDVFGNAGWEVGGPNGEIRTRLTRVGDHYTVSGRKYYSTGAMFADWITATARDDADEVVSFVLPRDRPGLTVLDDFDAVGQRLTASGTVELDNVIVHSSELRRHPHRGRRSPVTAFLQLYLAAVAAGIARNALTDAVGFARDHARPIAHSSAAASVDDPYVRHAVGEISARAYAAEAVVLQAAAAIDCAWGANLPPNLLVAAAVAVAQAQFFATEAALRAAELAFEVGGGSATARTHNLDRHWRNARTVANHNPRAWKAGVVGAYRLNGTEPPTSGLF